MQFTIEHYREVTSTNALALDYARRGKPEGWVIAADYQTKGRGRQGRTWLSPPGKNLLFSVIIRPCLSASKAPMVTQLTCRAIARMLTVRFGIVPEFKRPNDLLVNRKKICGILVETSSSGNKIDALVIGIGLNVNASENKLIPEAISIRQITGQEHDLKPLLTETLNYLKSEWETLYAYSS